MEKRQDMNSSKNYCPDRGDIVSIDLSSAGGHEQAGRRPVLVLSPHSYNIKSGLFIGAPLTRTVRGYPFESPVPEGLLADGVVLSDQMSSKSWQAQASRFVCKAPDALVDDVAAKAKALLP